jgi:hypothetical protein
MKKRNALNQLRRKIKTQTQTISSQALCLAELRDKLEEQRQLVDQFPGLYVARVDASVEKPELVFCNVMVNASLARKYPVVWDNALDSLKRQMARYRI